MRLCQGLFTKNDCYKAGKTIMPKGIMIHSTGANNPALKRYVGPDDGQLGGNRYNNHWNQPGLPVCPHAFIGRLENGGIAAYQVLPWNYRGWHAGGKANDTHIGIEICEDGLTDGMYFNAVYREAVELCTYLCKKYSINPGNILCHSEGFKRGVASNHADVMHWFPKHGKSMDTLRADVKALLEPAPPAKPEIKPAQTPVVTKPAASSGNSFKVGDRVKIKASAAKYTTGQTIPVWLKGKSIYVRQQGTGRTLVSTMSTGPVTGWVKTGDLEQG